MFIYTKPPKKGGLLRRIYDYPCGSPACCKTRNAARPVYKVMISDREKTVIDCIVGIQIDAPGVRRKNLAEIYGELRSRTLASAVA